MVGFGQWKAPAGEWNMDPAPSLPECYGWLYSFVKATAPIKELLDSSSSLFWLP